MVNNNIWANAYWNFFHIFSINVNDKLLNSKNLNLIHIFINNLIMSIPCEKCKIDTVQYFENKQFRKINTKEGFINFFYLFHNYVNFKTRKTGQTIRILELYKNISIQDSLLIIDKEIFKYKLNKSVYKFFIMTTR